MNTLGIGNLIFKLKKSVIALSLIQISQTKVLLCNFLAMQHEDRCASQNLWKARLHKLPSTHTYGNTHLQLSLYTETCKQKPAVTRLLFISQCSQMRFGYLTSSYAKLIAKGSLKALSHACFVPFNWQKHGIITQNQNKIKQFINSGFFTRPSIIKSSLYKLNENLNTYLVPLFMTEI